MKEYGEEIIKGADDNSANEYKGNSIGGHVQLLPSATFHVHTHTHPH